MVEEEEEDEEKEEEELNQASNKTSVRLSNVAPRNWRNNSNNLSSTSTKIKLYLSTFHEHQIPSNVREHNGLSSG